MRRRVESPVRNGRRSFSVKTRQLLGAFADVAPVMPYGGRADCCPSGGNFQTDKPCVFFWLGLGVVGCKHLAALREEFFSGGIPADSSHFLRELGESDGVGIRHDCKLAVFTFAVPEGVNCAVEFHPGGLEFLLFFAGLFDDASFSSGEKPAGGFAGKGCRSLIIRPRNRGAIRVCGLGAESLPECIEVAGFFHRRVHSYIKKK